MNTLIRLSSRPPMAALGLYASIVLVNEVPVSCLQHMYYEGRPHSHGLRRGDWMWPGDRNWRVQVKLVVIRAPKTARTAGLIQHVVVSDPFVVLLTQLAGSGGRSARSLRAGQPKDLAKWSRRMSILLGIPPVQFTPGGLQAGGYTHAYLTGSNVEQLLRRGRWSARGSLRHFVLESASVLALGQLPLATTRKLEAVAAAMVPVWNALTLSWVDMGEAA